jgi:chemotaxis protein histidine kinase CheA
MAGATILGDGRVALILDVSAVTRTHAARGPVKAAA